METCVNINKLKPKVTSERTHCWQFSAVLLMLVISETRNNKFHTTAIISNQNQQKVPRLFLHCGRSLITWPSGTYLMILNCSDFLSGVIQNYARKHGISVDRLFLDYEVLRPDESPASSPTDGVFIRVSYKLLETDVCMSVWQGNCYVNRLFMVWFRACSWKALDGILHLKC